MPCAKYEDQILDLQHGQLDPDSQRVVEEHLARCMACRLFAEDLRSLDEALCARFQRTELPASFSTTLWRRIEAEAPHLSPGLIATRKQALTSEFHAVSAGHAKHVVRDRFDSVLDGLAALGLTLATAFAAEQMLHRIPDLSKLLQAAMSQPPASCVVWAAGALCLVSAVWFGLKEHATRLIGRG
jgi:anti-sigma factor RsiW